MITKQLTLRDRMIKLLKRRSKGLRPIEIADKLGVPDSSVRRILSVHSNTFQRYVDMNTPTVNRYLLAA